MTDRLSNGEYMKNIKMRKLFVGILISVAVTMSFLCGCASSSEDTQQVAIVPKEEKESRKVIRIATWYDDSHSTNIKAFLAKRFPEYDFEYTYIQRTNYESVIDSQISYNGAADIICVTENMAKKYAVGGYLAPITNMVKGFSEDAIDTFKYQNEYYAVPGVSSFECHYYNQDYFDKLGFSEPSVYSDFNDMCKVILDNGMKPLSAGLKDKEGLASSVIAVMQGAYFNTPEGESFGERLQKGEASFYEELYPKIDIWYSFIEEGIFTPDMCLMDKQAAIEEFASGKTVFFVGGPEDYNQIYKANPSIRLGTIPFGGKDDGSQLLLGGCEYGFAVVNGNKNMEDALNVLRSLTTMIGQRALWKDSPGSKTYLRNIKFKTPKEFDNLEYALENCLYMPYTGWGYYSREISVELENELQQVLLGRETLENAFKRVDGKAKAIVEGN